MSISSPLPPPPPPPPPTHTLTLPQVTTTPPPADAPRRRFGSFNAPVALAPTSNPSSGIAGPGADGASRTTAGRASVSSESPSSPTPAPSTSTSGHRQRPSFSSSTIGSHPSYSSTSSAFPSTTQAQVQAQAQAGTLVPPPQAGRARSSSSASSTASHPNPNLSSRTNTPSAAGPGQTSPAAAAAGGFDITFAADKAQQWLSTWAPRGEGRGREFLNNTLNNVASVASTVTHNLNGGGAGSVRSNSFVSTTSASNSGFDFSNSNSNTNGINASPFAGTSPEDRFGVSPSPAASPSPTPTSSQFPHGSSAAPALGHSNSTPLFINGLPQSQAHSSRLNGAKKILQPANLARLGQSVSTSSASASGITTSVLASQRGSIGANANANASTTSLPNTPISRSSSSGTLTPSAGANATSAAPLASPAIPTGVTSLHGPSHLNPNASQTSLSPGLGHRRNSSTTSNPSSVLSSSPNLGVSPSQAAVAGGPAHRRSSSFGLNSFSLVKSKSHSTSNTNSTANVGSSTMSRTKSTSPSVSRSSSLTTRSNTANGIMKGTSVKSAGMPYKIGFQPQGVRSDRSEEYFDLRRFKGEEREREEGRLGRRWAKLVDLHFNPSIPLPPAPVPTLTRSSSSTFSLSTLSNPDRRRSLLSIDGALDALKPKELLKGLKGASSNPGGEEGRKRAAEQAIVKWEDDGEAKKCRICLSSFSISNRKHHCRLCGRIICSLQPTPPALLAVQIQLFAPSDPGAISTLSQAGLPPGTRREKCSLLLVADWKTGRGEEVEEGFVGWMKMEDPALDSPSSVSGSSQSPRPGLGSSPSSASTRGNDGEGGKRRKGRTSTASVMSTTSVSSDRDRGAEEKRDIPLPQQPKEVQVKGVRTCRECWAVVSRKQKMQDRQRVTGFAKLYQALRGLQAEIEDLMPEYEDQLAELTESNAPLDPPQETLQTHKTLLTLFAQYEHLSKRIGGLTCEEGGSQALVQSAVARSAAGFLAKEMVKLQALQRMQKKAAQAKRKTMAIRELSLSDTIASHNSGSSDGLDGSVMDKEMEDVAVLLQPLLEQEAQLESYISDANAQRKYEDSKALSEALKEIKAEIERITVGAR